MWIIKFLLEFSYRKKVYTEIFVYFLLSDCGNLCNYCTSLLTFSARKLIKVSLLVWGF
jgi:uncharacterized membrane protein